MAKLSMDRWDGVFCHDDAYAVVPGDDLASFIARLDGRRHTCFSIEDEQEQGLVLIVGGGPSLFVVTRQLFHDTFWTLINPHGNATDMVELCMGGRYGDYASRIVVGPDVARRAAAAFLARVPDPGLVWEED